MSEPTVKFHIIQDAAPSIYLGLQEFTESEFLLIASRAKIVLDGHDYTIQRIDVNNKAIFVGHRDNN